MPLGRSNAPVNQDVASSSELSVAASSATRSATTVGPEFKAAVAAENELAARHAATLPSLRALREAGSKDKDLRRMEQFLDARELLVKQKKKRRRREEEEEETKVKKQKGKASSGYDKFDLNLGGKAKARAAAQRQQLGSAISNAHEVRFCVCFGWWMVDGGWWMVCGMEASWSYLTMRIATRHLFVTSYR